LRNVYGWFERTAPGRYRLTALGDAALRRWPATLAATAPGPPAGLEEAVAMTISGAAAIIANRPGT
ncbi:MAG: hypothetical protein WA417_16285, partial [Stellaceae bacterium]